MIFADIVAKLPALKTQGRTVVDIGPGCGGLPHMLIDLCRQASSSLLFVDSPEMLAELPDQPFIRKLPGRFPDEVPLDEYTGVVDLVLVYSVLHYIVAAETLWAFLDRALALLGSGGSMLLGDIPNVSKRARFFSSEAGIAFHRAFMGDDTPPNIRPQNEAAKIDDSLLLELLGRTRANGFDAYILPQAAGLPMANRREDILIVRP
jgi:hypothetical protein